MIDHQPIVVIAVGLLEKSKNAKTGAAIQVFILRSDVNPIHALHTGKDASICGDCIHRHTYKESNRYTTGVEAEPATNSCYVLHNQAPLAVYRAYHRGIYPAFDIWKHGDLFRGRFIRFGAYGDPAAVPIPILRAFAALAGRHTAYTHQWKTCRPAYSELCMASVENEAERELAHAKGYRTFRVKLPDEQRHEGEAMCPASHEYEERTGKKTTCLRCALCDGQPVDRAHRADIVINVHGVKFKQQAYLKKTAEASQELMRTGRISLVA